MYKISINLNLININQYMSIDVIYNQDILSYMLFFLMQSKIL